MKPFECTEYGIAYGVGFRKDAMIGGHNTEFPSDVTTTIMLRDASIVLGWMIRSND